MAIWELWAMGFTGPPADGLTPTGQCRRFLSNVTRAPATGYRSPSPSLARHRFATDQGRLDFASVFFDDGKMVGVALYATAASRLRAPKLEALPAFHVKCPSLTGEVCSSLRRAAAG